MNGILTLFKMVILPILSLLWAVEDAQVALWRHLWMPSKMVALRRSSTNNNKKKSLNFIALYACWTIATFSIYKQNWEISTRGNVDSFERERERNIKRIFFIFNGLVHRYQFTLVFSSPQKDGSFLRHG